MNNYNCNNCGSVELIQLIDAGNQPVCNRFVGNYSAGSYRYPLVVNQCKVCGEVQINNPVPVEEVVPQYDWITYNEPEAHLDNLVDKIISLESIDKDSIICGITFKDDSTLLRLKNKGFKNIWRIDNRIDLGISNPLANLETIQGYINPQAISGIVARRGLADLVVVRHILEHAYNTHRFIEGIKKLIKPTGYIVFEVPDCTQAFERCDYTTLWEEHILYFTQETFKNCLGFHGLSLANFQCYPNPFENSLVAITRTMNEQNGTLISNGALAKELERAKVFSRNFPIYLQKTNDFLSRFKKEKGKIAIFGAGHLACTFINSFGLEPFIDFCVDDNPNKKGLCLPGTQLPIYDSVSLAEKDIRLCLLTLNPINEDKIVAKSSSFVDKGGIFLSVFPISRRAMQNYLF